MIIRSRQRDLVVSSLRAGVVPKDGLHLIQVGRKNEVETMTKDINRIKEGGSTFRIIIGDYGSGKTFFLTLVRSVALKLDLVTATVDLSPDRRLHSTGGEALALYRELIHSLACKSHPDGGALGAIFEKFARQTIDTANAKALSVRSVVSELLSPLEEMVGGYDFVTVIRDYVHDYDTDNEARITAAIRWMRGEYSTKTEARAALGVRNIISDENIYSHIKLLAKFIKLAGYAGLMITLDEMINLHRLSNSKARSTNYEQLLAILNESLQGRTEYVGFVMGGTPEFLTDPRRGCYSYQALASRLSENSFSTDELKDYNSTVLRLHSLSQEDMYVLLENLRYVYFSGDESKYLISDDGLKSFMDHCNAKIGQEFFRTPRNTIREFVNLLAILEQNPGTNWNEIIPSIKITPDQGVDLSPTGEEEDELESFRL